MLLAETRAEVNIMKLDIKAFSLTCGIVAAIGLLLVTGWARVFDGPNGPTIWLSHVYRGYSLTLVGGLIGAAWAFVEGVIGGAIFAWLYDAIDARLVVRHRVIE